MDTRQALNKPIRPPARLERRAWPFARIAMSNPSTGSSALSKTNNDLAYLFRQYDIDASKVKRQLEHAQRLQDRQRDDVSMAAKSWKR